MQPGPWIMGACFRRRCRRCRVSSLRMRSNCCEAVLISPADVAGGDGIRIAVKLIESAALFAPSAAHRATDVALRTIFDGAQLWPVRLCALRSVPEGRMWLGRCPDNRWNNVVDSEL